MTESVVMCSLIIVELYKKSLHIKQIKSASLMSLLCAFYLRS